MQLHELLQNLYLNVGIGNAWTWHGMAAVSPKTSTWLALRKRESASRGARSERGSAFDNQSHYQKVAENIHLNVGNGYACTLQGMAAIWALETVSSNPVTLGSLFLGARLDRGSGKRKKWLKMNASMDLPVLLEPLCIERKRPIPLWTAMERW